MIMDSMHTNRTATATSLDFDSVPMVLWEKAKRFGVWNPADIDFSQDVIDWSGMSDEERDALTRLGLLFHAGEEAVTLDLLPLIQTVAEEGRVEETIFLTSFLWEEAKHTELFARFFRDVAVQPADPGAYLGPNYDRIFSVALPSALQALGSDRKPTTQARAATTYNLIVEGVLAETGYYGYRKCLQENGIMPGMVKAVGLIKQDESRHIAYGLHLLLRLLREGDAEVWEVIESTASQLLSPAIGVVEEIFSAYDPMPFGLDLSEFVEYAMRQFSTRYEWLERWRDADDLPPGGLRTIAAISGE